MTEKIRNRKRMKLDKSFMFRKFRKELEWSEKGSGHLAVCGTYPAEAGIG